ncbi:DUF5330 domain-containing protein [Stappia sp.]|jgi:hypothetical protein|uniref:DUF5330 domain-containing protein n=1 Tax=Stappia sp. TaxID=1870903 RepID=UPI003D142241
MFFLLRSAFWIGLILLLLPIDTGSEETSGTGINPVTAFFAAQSTISDLSGFCERNPQTCETGGQAITQIGAKAKVSAKMLYDYLDEDGNLTTGATGSLTGTLTASDLEPDWTLPAPVATVPADSAERAADRTGERRAAQAASVPGTTAVPLPKPALRDRPA